MVSAHWFPDLVYTGPTLQPGPLETNGFLLPQYILRVGVGERKEKKRKERNAFFSFTVLIVLFLYEKIYRYFFLSRHEKWDSFLFKFLCVWLSELVSRQINSLNAENILLNTYNIRSEFKSEIRSPLHEMDTYRSLT
jgi:hypothetical protein